MPPSTPGTPTVPPSRTPRAAARTTPAWPPTPSHAPQSPAPRPLQTPRRPRPLPPRTTSPRSPGPCPQRTSPRCRGALTRRLRVPTVPPQTRRPALRWPSRRLLLPLQRALGGLPPRRPPLTAPRIWLRPRPHPRRSTIRSPTWRPGVLPPPRRPSRPTTTPHRATAQLPTLRALPRSRPTPRSTPPRMPRRRMPRGGLPGHSPLPWSLTRDRAVSAPHSAGRWQGPSSRGWG